MEENKKCKNGCCDSKHEHKHEEHCNCGHDHHDHCDCGCCDDELNEDIIEITADDGRKLKFFLVGTIEYNGKTYAAFEPAEEIEGLTEDSLVIYEVGGNPGDEDAELIEITDEALLEEVFQEFCRVLEEDELAEEAEELEPSDK